MTDEAQEAARKLFAGACDFVWGATSAENHEAAKIGQLGVDLAQPLCEARPVG